MLEQKEKPRKFFTVFSIINVLLFLITILSGFYFFYIKKNFDFIIESPCDPNLEQCFIRDCLDYNDCPDNMLENFKRYSLSAHDFKYCEGEDCTNVCENKEIDCEKLECFTDIDMGEECSVLLEDEKIEEL